MNNARISFNAVAAIAGTIIITSYIFFGGSLTNKDIRKRKTRKKDTIPGLENLGNTCFLNCILQALSSCALFRAWLEGEALKEAPVLLHALREVLTALNNGAPSPGGAPGPPSAVPVLASLRSHGWVISAREEQDAHELFHALSASIGDEVARLRRQRGSLLDVSWVREGAERRLEGAESLFKGAELGGRRPGHRLEGTELRREGRGRESAVCKVPFSVRCPPPRTAPAPLQSPFKGHLASQLQCNVCGFKNAEQWSPFESLSLPLPPSSPPLSSSLSSSLSLPGSGEREVGLEDLLSAFVGPESVAGVTCEGCSEEAKRGGGEGEGAKTVRTVFTKRLTIGKLPACLCFHVQRTVWLSGGRPWKRGDWVRVPLLVDMAPFTYRRNAGKQVLKGGLLGGRAPAAAPSAPLRSKDPAPLRSQDPQPNRCVWPRASCSMYKLASVVEHVGDAFSGHFVTYRRGPASSEDLKDRWFYTSDLSVREVSADDVLRVNAYMLVYERLT